MNGRPLNYMVFLTIQLQHPGLALLIPLLSTLMFAGLLCIFLQYASQVLNKNYKLLMIVMSRLNDKRHFADLAFISTWKALDNPQKS